MGRNSGARFLRERSACFRSQIFRKIASSFRSGPQFLPTPSPWAPVFPVRCYASRAARSSNPRSSSPRIRSRSHSRAASSPTLAATITTRTTCVCAASRYGKVVVHAVETEAQEMLNLLCWSPPLPAGWLVGSGKGWQARDSYDIAVLIDGAGLSQPAHRRACHRASMWRHPDLRQGVTRACV